MSDQPAIIYLAVVSGTFLAACIAAIAYILRMWRRTGQTAGLTIFTMMAVSVAAFMALPAVYYFLDSLLILVTRR